MNALIHSKSRTESGTKAWQVLYDLSFLYFVINKSPIKDWQLIWDHVIWNQVRVRWCPNPPNRLPNKERVRNETIRIFRLILKGGRT